MDCTETFSKKVGGIDKEGGRDISLLPFYGKTDSTSSGLLELVVMAATYRQWVNEK